MRLIMAMHVLWAFCSFLALFLLLPSWLCAHDLDDGFVERAVQARIRDGKLTIEYAIGLTEPTMEQLLDSEASAATPESDSPLERSQTSVRERFKQHLEGLLQKQLHVKFNESTCSMELQAITDYPKHHYDFVATMSCKLSPEQTVKLRIQDACFSDLDGGARYALKSRGKTIISRTNVAPIIIRAKRHELSGLKPDERHKACQISATVVGPGMRAKD